MAKGKRKEKTSKGINGGGGRLNRPWTEVEKVLMGKGMLVNANRPRKEAAA